MIYRPGLTRAQFTGIAADIIATHILDSYHEQANAISLLLSGGSTPGPVYSLLSNVSLPWASVNIGLVDERWVEQHDPGSNADLIHNTLMQGYAEDACFSPMKTKHETPQAGQEEVEARYKSLVNENALAVLGMGTDGHVCSWFPKSQGLDVAANLHNPDVVQAITAQKSEITGDYLQRMTLTLTALKRCKSVLLLITGDEKRRVLEAAMNNPASELPVGHILSLETLTILHAA